MHTFWVFHVCVSCKQQQPTANRKKVKMTGETMLYHRHC